MSETPACREISNDDSFLRIDRTILIEKFDYNHTWTQAINSL